MILVRFTAAALAAVATVAAIDTTAVRAQTIEGDQASMRVSYKDLDMRTPQGHKQFVERVRRASRLVCDATNPGVPFYLINECAAKATTIAMDRYARDQRPATTLAAR